MKTEVAKARRKGLYDNSSRQNIGKRTTLISTADRHRRTYHTRKGRERKHCCKGWGGRARKAADLCV